ncbi:MAG: indole-3-glycerol phosphate synthase TrpC [Fidelibacterota bacterium]|nr:MAG: indole-3-glycerol phosphate synthase TrpC [Candidatus Neomarinimicrobiota bacterium]
MSILDEIIAHKTEEVRRRQDQLPLETFLPRDSSVRDFAGALAQPGLRIIAEVKRKSPSRGNIRLDLEPADLAQAYQQAGAAAISVLTDEKYFGGSLDHLAEVRAAVDLPVLRKDFVISEYQVHESYHADADAILLIADALPFDKLRRLYQLADSQGLHVLVEGHSDEALAHIQRLAPRIAGINSRDLTTMQVDLEAMLKRRQLLPKGVLQVAESGITGPEDLPRVARAGFDAALIGTALLTEGDPGETLRQFLASGIVASESPGITTVEAPG